VATWAAANGYVIGLADGKGKASNHPVYHVSWYEAMEWAKARDRGWRRALLYPDILHAAR
jgi:formylglycine-generating enzyme required for sulfatase activity